ncbi:MULTISPECIES: Cys-tRNA(Pro) deacylase [Salinicola]|uniref:Cys-tRNA(Pro)/Cys-tRNA(Cys) deacylase n=1 Tax=Salinicola socius TaxID=404433 RepID=A0A1Q8SXF5_9GAMM|nr:MULTISPECIES: Cys-tRNA(Pro) deacylase [Salinicola]OLO06094.1 aminoacyl-tRNA deacylase [Salinicola socius]
MTPAVRLLESRKIPHQVTSYELNGESDSQGSYGLDAAQALSLPPASVFKTLLAQLDDGRLVVALVPVDATLDLKALAKAAGGRRGRMAEAATAERTTGYLVGGISPLGQKKRLPTFIDESAMTLATIHVSGGRRGLELSLAPNDLIALTAARTADLARRG